MSSNFDILWSYLAGVDDPEMILRPLANYLRPMLLDSWKERRKALFTENTEKMKRVLDDLQKKLDEVSTIGWLLFPQNVTESLSLPLSPYIYIYIYIYMEPNPSPPAGYLDC